ncbi:MAG: tRNA (cytidine(34)-2'-O)-methyltransferase [Casimicrobiaceae bacterium]|nr:tRNA (cytidine(34)-2'-O)-methyltransferase [Casimicrobiaceae bacterium]MCX8098308.1 tRNA (cytidine(34)-2'-O)-methyltransferase [Casimicrobiaceae bacterium]MDW8311756.1 tRNA (cytidine(34)-2'-O)-methyltransferase [Burkholderiales bacterium]
MIAVVLVAPQIPPNTGNVIRLCANTGAELHLVEPLGFRLEDAKLRRAGLDYREYARVRVHADWATLRRALAGRRLWAIETGAPQRVHEASFALDDVLVFGNETTGLPNALFADFPPEQRLSLPMRPGNRSLNLSNAVAVTVFEAWRQLGFPGACDPS